MGRYARKSVRPRVGDVPGVRRAHAANGHERHVRSCGQELVLEPAPKLFVLSSGSISHFLGIASAGSEPVSSTEKKTSEYEHLRHPETRREISETILQREVERDTESANPRKEVFVLHLTSLTRKH